VWVEKGLVPDLVDVGVAGSLEVKVPSFAEVVETAVTRVVGMYADDEEVNSPAHVLVDGPEWEA